MSFMNVAGSTSNRLSMLSSPSSGNAIKSLFFAKKPAPIRPNKLPRRKIAVTPRFRGLARWWMTLTFSPGLARLSSRGVGGSEDDSEAGTTGGPRRRTVLAIEEGASGSDKGGSDLLSSPDVPSEGGSRAVGRRGDWESRSLQPAVQSTRPPVFGRCICECGDRLMLNERKPKDAMRASLRRQNANPFP